MRRALKGSLLVGLIVLALGTAASASGELTIAVLTLHKTALGKVVATAGRSGRTVYMYTPDAKRVRPHCYTGCAGPWRPLISSYTAAAEGGVRSWLVGMTFLEDGQSQVTYNNRPLYLYAGDSKPGQVKGEGRQGLWFAVNVSGNKVKRKGH